MQLMALIEGIIVCLIGLLLIIFNKRFMEGEISLLALFIRRVKPSEKKVKEQMLKSRSLSFFWRLVAIILGIFLILFGVNLLWLRQL